MGLSLPQLQTILRQAGWPEAQIPVMASIALAESGGNPQSHNPKPPDDSYGLWQINMLGRLGPERRAQFGIDQNTDLYDPLTNARAALFIYKKQGLRAWSTYSNGAYKKFLTASKAAVSASGEVHPEDTSQTIPDATVTIDTSSADSGAVVDDAGATADGGLDVTTLAMVGAALVGLYFLFR